MLQVKRQKDKRVIKSILHRIADIIPGGVTINTSGTSAVRALLEGTPIGPGSDGMYHVQKDRIDCHNSKCNSYGLQKLPKGITSKPEIILQPESC